MITKSEFVLAQTRAAEMIRDAGLVIRPEEAESIEVADFGLGRLETEGAQILTLVQTDRISCKVLALVGYQTEPEHWHVSVGDDPGKEETVRVLWGKLDFFTPGEDNTDRSLIPSGKEECYTCRNHIRMLPGDQLTLEPGVKHWFRAGADGAVLASISTVARDDTDRFTDPNVVRKTVVNEE